MTTIRSRLVRALPLLAAASLACSSAASPLGSIGAVLERESSTGVVIAFDVPEGSSADRAGIRTGDRLKMVDGNHVDDLDETQFVRLLRGAVGTSVTLTVLRGERVLEVTLVREARRPSVAPVPERQRLE